MRRSAGLHGFASLAALALISGCAGAPPPPPPNDPLPRDLRPFLIDPVDPTDQRPEAGEVHRLYLRLTESGDVTGVERAAGALLGRSPELAPARVLLAQARLVAGDYRGAADAARESGEPGGLSARLVEARALEGLGDLPAALALYRAQLSATEAAAARAAAIEPRVIEILEHRIEDALGRGQIDLAQRELDGLEKLRPKAEATLRLGLRVASAQGDLPQELALVRSLVAAVPGDRELVLRRGQLEVAVGDARAGIELLQKLADATPSDGRLAEELRRAKFRWRVINAPEPVRRAAERPQVTRADLAVLLYWLVPQVRTARGGSGRIASDILEHPAQEAIIRVVNLGLLGLDETLHRFDPDRPARRSELLRALLRLLAEADPAGCAGAASAGGDPSREALCGTAVACGLTPGPSDCLPSAPLSGAEALEVLRLALAVLERS
jgi:hypothetical protein